MHDNKKIYEEDKQKFYKILNLKLVGYISSETDWLANLSNAAALLYQNLDKINWAGFYLMKNEKLVLGPFQGKPACTHIDLGKGVCGTAVLKREAQVVEDVHNFPGHIACDSDTKSEIVIPIILNDLVVGVLDIDSPILNRFNDEDAICLKKFVNTLNIYVDWLNIK